MFDVIYLLLHILKQFYEGLDTKAQFCFQKFLLEWFKLFNPQKVSLSKLEKMVFNYPLVDPFSSLFLSIPYKLLCFREFCKGTMSVYVYI